MKSGKPGAVESVGFFKPQAMVQTRLAQLLQCLCLSLQGVLFGAKASVSTGTVLEIASMALKPTWEIGCVTTGKLEHRV